MTGALPRNVQNQELSIADGTVVMTMEFTSDGTSKESSKKPTDNEGNNSSNNAMKDKIVNNLKLRQLNQKDKKFFSLSCWFIGSALLFLLQFRRV
jgi:hypothetical protein